MLARLLQDAMSKGRVTDMRDRETRPATTAAQAAGAHGRDGGVVPGARGAVTTTFLRDE